MSRIVVLPKETDRLYWSPAYSSFFVGDVINANFGASPFAYPVPAGYSVFSSGAWSPTYKGSGITLSGGNLIANGNDAAHHAGAADWSRITGKWYWETTMTVIGGGNSIYVGVIAPGQTVEGFFLGQTPDGIGVAQSGGIARNNTLIGTILGFATSSVVRHKLDLDAQTYEQAVNGSVFNLVDNL